MDSNVLKQLDNAALQMGKGISGLSFEVVLNQGETSLGPDKFGLKLESQNGGSFTFRGRWRDINASWEFTPGAGFTAVKLRLWSEYPLECTSIANIRFKYTPGPASIGDWMVPAYGSGLARAGMARVKELSTRLESRMTGLFKDSSTPGVLLASRIPQRNVQRYSAEPAGEGAMLFGGTTSLTAGQSRGKELSSETTMVFTGRTVGEALKVYSGELPVSSSLRSPGVGWNSWDYYFRAVSLDDMLENLDELKNDPILSEKVKYVVVDDGWQYVWGEWEPNHKFPGGLERLAEEIRSRGFIPGIWTAPLMAEYLSLPASRQYDMLVKNKYGDPQPCPGADSNYIVDPTHPKGRKFISEIFTRLYKAGFRLFKVDYVYLTGAYSFHEADKGPYDAARELFSIIRESVGEDSFILGCSLPAEAGPGCAQSGRIGIDIHNQWNHVEWEVDTMQYAYVYHNKIWVNDADFLIVRGLDTSLEEETNILNPHVNNPEPEGDFFKRWRRGPVFSYDEARTWATLVLLTGGNIFLSDRLSMLNEKGRELIRKALVPAGEAAVPLDLCDDIRPSLWLQDLKDSYRLGVINWSGEKARLTFDFARYGLEAPSSTIDYWSSEKAEIRDGRVELSLEPHASCLLCWSKQGDEGCRT